MLPWGSHPTAQQISALSSFFFPGAQPKLPFALFYAITLALGDGSGNLNVMGMQLII